MLEDDENPMPLSPALLPYVADAIGVALKRAQLEEIVRAATGNELFVEYASPDDPTGRAVARTLEKLALEGSERWLLTYALTWAVTDDRLRQLILDACPETIVSSAAVDEEVEQVLANLDRALALPLPRPIRDDLSSRRHALRKIPQQIAELLAYKSLQECVRGLQADLSFDLRLTSAAAKFANPSEYKETLKQFNDASKRIRDASASLGAASEAQRSELGWGAELERLADQARSALDAGDPAAASASLNEMQRLVRLNLSRLNGRIFESAKLFSLHPLIEKPSAAFIRNESFIPLAFAIRNLNPAVLARALVYKIWQEADDEIALIGDLLDGPADAHGEFDDHWRTLKSRIRWLTESTPWWKSIDDCSAEIDDKLADEDVDSDIKPLFDAYRRIVALAFRTVDTIVKPDFASLGRIDPRLRTILQDIGHA